MMLTTATFFAEKTEEKKLKKEQQLVIKKYKNYTDNKVKKYLETFTHYTYENQKIEIEYKSYSEKPRFYWTADFNCFCEIILKTSNAYLIRIEFYWKKNEKQDIVLFYELKSTLSTIQANLPYNDWGVLIDLPSFPELKKVLAKALKTPKLIKQEEEKDIKEALAFTKVAYKLKLKKVLTNLLNNQT